MMITIVLSSNMPADTKDHVLVRKLVGIETSEIMVLLPTNRHYQGKARSAIL